MHLGEKVPFTSCSSLSLGVMVMIGFPWAGLVFIPSRGLGVFILAGLTTWGRPGMDINSWVRISTLGRVSFAKLNPSSSFGWTDLVLSYVFLMITF